MLSYKDTAFLFTISLTLVMVSALNEAVLSDCLPSQKRYLISRSILKFPYAFLKTVSMI